MFRLGPDEHDPAVEAFGSQRFGGLGAREARADDGEGALGRHGCLELVMSGWRPPTAGSYEPCGSASAASCSARGGLVPRTSYRCRSSFISHASTDARVPGVSAGSIAAKT